MSKLTHNQTSQPVQLLRCKAWHPQYATIKRTHNTKLHRCMYCGKEWHLIKTVRYGWLELEIWKALYGRQSESKLEIVDYRGMMK